MCLLSRIPICLLAFIQLFFYLELLHTIVESSLQNYSRLMHTCWLITPACNTITYVRIWKVFLLSQHRISYSKNKILQTTQHASSRPLPLTTKIAPSPVQPSTLEDHKITKQSGSHFPSYRLAVNNRIKTPKSKTQKTGKVRHEQTLHAYPSLQTSTTKIIFHFDIGPLARKVPQ